MSTGRVFKWIGNIVLRKKKKGGVKDDPEAFALWRLVLFGGGFGESFWSSETRIVLNEDAQWYICMIRWSEAWSLRQKQCPEVHSLCAAQTCCVKLQDAKLETLREETCREMCANVVIRDTPYFTRVIWQWGSNTPGRLLSSLPDKILIPARTHTAPWEDRRWPTLASLMLPS